MKTLPAIIIRVTGKGSPSKITTGTGSPASLVKQSINQGSILVAIVRNRADLAFFRSLVRPALLCMVADNC